MEGRRGGFRNGLWYLKIEDIEEYFVYIFTSKQYIHISHRPPASPLHHPVSSNQALSIHTSLLNPPTLSIPALPPPSSSLRLPPLPFPLRHRILHTHHHHHHHNPTTPSNPTTPNPIVFPPFTIDSPAIFPAPMRSQTVHVNTSRGLWKGRYTTPPPLLQTESEFRHDGIDGFWSVSTMIDKEDRTAASWTTLVFLTARVDFVAEGGGGCV